MDLAIEADFDEAFGMDTVDDTKSLQADFNRSFKTNVEELKNRSAAKSSPEHSQESDVDCVLNSINPDASPAGSVIEKSSEFPDQDEMEDDEIDRLDSQFSEVDSIVPSSQTESQQLSSSTDQNSPADQNSPIDQVTTSQEVLLLTNPVFRLPDHVIGYLKVKHITSLFQWQYDCLTAHPGILAGTKNLIFSAPTSAGKSIIADILIHNQLSKTPKKKVLIVLPYISLANEKMQQLQNMFKFSNFSIGGFMGNALPSGGFPATDIAVCTIEKANNIVNKLVAEGKLADIGMVVVDELHEIGTSERGHLLEQMLTKIKFSKKQGTRSEPGKETEPIDVQVVGMSATLPNLKELADWMDAQLFESDFRPVPLQETIKIGTEISKVERTPGKERPDLILHRTIDKVDIKWHEDKSNLLALALETVLEGYSVLVFCNSKSSCEERAKSLAAAIQGIVRMKTEKPNLLKAQATLKNEVLKNDGAFQKEIQEQLSKTPANLDSTLKATLLSAVAYHNADLSVDERDIIESGFKDGHIRVIFCTPTLAAGVNLPGKCAFRFFHIQSIFSLS